MSPSNRRGCPQGAPIDLARLIYRAGFFPHEARIQRSAAGPPVVLIKPSVIERRSLRIDDLLHMCRLYRVECLMLPDLDPISQG